MTKKNITTIKKIITEHLIIADKTQLLYQINLKNYGADSLDIIQIILQLEEIFNIEITDKETKNIKTLQDIINIVDLKIKNKK